RQGLHRFLHERDADPLVALRADDWAVLRAIDCEGSLLHARISLVRDADFRRHNWTLLVPVLVKVRVAFLDDRFEVFIHLIDRARRVHPAAMLVETLIDEELSPRDRAISIEAFIASHLQFGSEVEGRVRIDQQERVLSHCVRRGERNAVRAAGIESQVTFISSRNFAALFIEGLELIELNRFDVAANAAFAERESHPGFEMRDYLWRYFRMVRQIEVQSVGPRIHQSFQ